MAVAVDTQFVMAAFLRLLSEIAQGMRYAMFHMADVRPLLLDVISKGDVAEAWRYNAQGQLPHLHQPALAQHLVVAWTDVVGATGIEPVTPAV